MVDYDEKPWKDTVQKKIAFLQTRNDVYEKKFSDALSLIDSILDQYRYLILIIYLEH